MGRVESHNGKKDEMGLWKDLSILKNKPFTHKHNTHTYKRSVYELTYLYISSTYRQFPAPLGKLGCKEKGMPKKNQQECRQDTGSGMDFHHSKNTTQNMTDTVAVCFGPNLVHSRGDGGSCDEHNVRGKLSRPQHLECLKRNKR